MKTTSALFSVLLACGSAAGRVLRSSALLSGVGLGLLAATAAAQIAPNVTRTTIAGMDVLLYRTGVKDVVTLRGTFPAGDAFSADTNSAVATLTGLMLDKGTTTEDKFAIAKKLESVGAAISFSIDNQMTGFSAKCLKPDVPLVVALLAEQLRSPAFNEAEFAKVKKQYVGGLKRALDDADGRAEEAFALAVYPAGHPNRPTPSAAQIAAVESATLDEVKAFHAKYYGPAHLTVVAVGDLDVAQMQAELGRAFAGWTGGVAAMHPPAPPVGDAAKELNVFMPDKTSVTILLGQPSGVKFSDADYQALRVATGILGSGFTSRLVGNVRDTEGLTYRINSAMANDTFTAGDWKIYASFAPNLLEKGVASTKRQLAKWYDAGVTDKEVADKKTALVGQFKVGLATSDGLAGTLLATVNRGLDLSWLDQYSGKIAGLTTAEVNAAIKKHLQPDAMVLVKAGTIPGAVPAAK
ncbi:MAG: insulinase family protein [Opitutae bacterium]|nr:insulinase family protein [Opitutae bacterium]